SFGSGNNIPQAAAIDATGNIWIVGNTDSDDFILVNPIISGKVPYRTAAFVVKLSPSGDILFATYINGKTIASRSDPLTHQSTATAIALDSLGNAYVGGSTDEPDFPVTVGNAAPGFDSFGNTFTYSYLAKISPAGRLIYARELTTGYSSC